MPQFGVFQSPLDGQAGHGLRQERERQHKRAAQVYLVCLLYGFGLLTVVLVLFLRSQVARRPVQARDRGQAQGELLPHVPRLNTDAPMANAAVLNRALDDVHLRASSSSLWSDTDVMPC